MRKNKYVSKERSVIGKEGVYKYSADQVGVEGGGDIYNVYIPENELRAAIPELKNLAVIDRHQWIGDRRLTQQDITAVGAITEDIIFEGGEIKAKLAIFDNPANFKNRQLSLGYKVNYKKQKGVFNGQEYDFVAQNMRDFDHLALVDKARIGNVATIMDEILADKEGILAFDACFDEYELTNEAGCVNNTTFNLIQGDEKMDAEVKEDLNITAVDALLKSHTQAMDAKLSAVLKKVDEFVESQKEVKIEASAEEVKQADQELAIKDALETQKKELKALDAFKELVQPSVGSFEAETMDAAVGFVAEHLKVKGDQNYIEGFLAGAASIKKPKVAMDSKTESVDAVPFSNTAF